MATETKTPPILPKSPTPLSTGSWSKEEFLAQIAEIKRRKDDPEYIAFVRRLGEGAAEARRQINEAELRALDAEEDGK